MRTGFELSVRFEVLDSGFEVFVFLFEFFHRFHEYRGNVGVLYGFISVRTGPYERRNLFFDFLRDESDLGPVSLERVFPFEGDASEAGNGFEGVREGFDVFLEAFVGSDVERGRVYRTGMPCVSGSGEPVLNRGRGFGVASSACAGRAPDGKPVFVLRVVMDVESQIGLISHWIHPSQIRVVRAFRNRSKPERVPGIETDVAGYVQLVVGVHGTDSHVSRRADACPFGVVRTEREGMVRGYVHDDVRVLPGLHIEHLSSFRIRNMEHGHSVSGGVVRMRPHDDSVAAHDVELVSGSRRSNSNVPVREREIRQPVVEGLQRRGNFIPFGSRNSRTAHGGRGKIRYERGISYGKSSERSEERGSPDDGGFEIFHWSEESFSKIILRICRPKRRLGGGKRSPMRSRPGLSLPTRVPSRWISCRLRRI